jgi:hypothetical protein
MPHGVTVRAAMNSKGIDCATPRDGLTVLEAKRGERYALELE